MNIEAGAYTATGTLTETFSLRVAGPPTGGATNWSVWVDAGTTRLDGDLDQRGTNVGFYGATPIPRASALTTALTTITNAFTGTDFVISTPIDSDVAAAWGFANQEEFESLVDVVANLQIRQNELDVALAAVGIIN